VISQPAPVATVENLEAVLQVAGLTMAVTDPEKLRSVQQSTPAVVEQRVPRERKPTPVIADEPLVQVETQR
jgi:ribonuclease E